MWSIDVLGNWRIIFHFAGHEVVESIWWITIDSYGLRETPGMGFEQESIRMHTPAHPGEIIGEVVKATGWTVAEAAAELGVVETTLFCLLNREAGITSALALAFERVGWSDAEFWMRLQASWELARERRRQEIA